MTDREILELIATQVGKLTTQFDTFTNQVDTLTTRVDTLTNQVDTLTTRVDTLTKDMAEIKPRLESIETTVIRIENEHGQKLGALFDGYKLNSEKLDRIENEVAKHEEIIFRRIR